MTSGCAPGPTSGPMTSARIRPPFTGIYRVSCKHGRAKSYLSPPVTPTRLSSEVEALSNIRASEDKESVLFEKVDLESNIIIRTFGIHNTGTLRERLWWWSYGEGSRWIFNFDRLE